MKLDVHSDGKVGPNQVEIENWTKWRIFLNSSTGSRQVVYGNSLGKIDLENGLVRGLTK